MQKKVLRRICTQNQMRLHHIPHDSSTISYRMLQKKVLCLCNADKSAEIVSAIVTRRVHPHRVARKPTGAMKYLYMYELGLNLPLTTIVVHRYCHVVVQRGLLQSNKIYTGNDRTNSTAKAVHMSYFVQGNKASASGFTALYYPLRCSWLPSSRRSLPDATAAFQTSGGPPVPTSSSRA